MTGNEYQALAMRTNDGKSTDRVISGVLTCDLKWLHNQNVVREDTEGLDLGGVLNGCLGLAGESGEVLDMVKKWIFHEKKMDKYHLKKELGDVMWYVAMLCESFGFAQAILSTVRFRVKGVIINHSQKMLFTVSYNPSLSRL